jgi:hypothetical protein
MVDRKLARVDAVQEVSSVSAMNSSVSCDSSTRFEAVQFFCDGRSTRYDSVSERSDGCSSI